MLTRRSAGFGTVFWHSVGAERASGSGVHTALMGLQPLPQWAGSDILEVHYLISRFATFAFIWLQKTVVHKARRLAKRYTNHVVTYGAIAH